MLPFRTPLAFLVLFFVAYFFLTRIRLYRISFIHFSGKNQQHHTGCTKTAFQKRAQDNIRTILPAQLVAFLHEILYTVDEQQ
jgi:hypothetical protein